MLTSLGLWVLRLFITGLYELVRLSVRHLPTANQRKQTMLLMERFIGARSCIRQFHSRDGIRFSDDLREFIPRQIYLAGERERCLTRYLRTALKTGDGFIDIGANIGYFSLLASVLIGESGGVVAIEPNPNTFTRLVRNIGLNGIPNIRAVNVAASNRSCEMTIYEPEGDCGAATIFKELVQQRSALREQRVFVKSVLSILTASEIEHARVIKIDVEGAEWDVCTELLPALSNDRTDVELVVEISPKALLSEGHTAVELLSRFSEYGFVPYSIQNAYSVSFLVSRHIECRPTRLRTNIEGRTDLIFSRRELDQL